MKKNIGGESLLTSIEEKVTQWSEVPNACHIGNVCIYVRSLALTHTYACTHLHEGMCAFTCVNAYICMHTPTRRHAFAYAHVATL